MVPLHFVGVESLKLSVLVEGGNPKIFFYFYSCSIFDIHVRFPFDEFTMEVLHVLNIAPTQLHPNSWVAL